jgi:class 3 adenylate cyclase
MSSETEALFTALRQAAAPEIVAAIETAVREAPDHELCRINALAFAASHGVDEEATIAAFLHAARLGLFELAWNVLCPGCSGVLDSGTTLRTLNRAEYACSLCASAYEPTLDEMVEVTFTVSPRVRRIAAHDPDSLPLPEYARQLFWSSGLDLPEGEGLEALFDEVVLDAIELPPGEKATMSLPLPAEFIILFDPVTHAAEFIDVKGEPTRERRTLSVILGKDRIPPETRQMSPGPVRISFDNRSERRTLPGVWVGSHALHTALGKRRPFLTAKRLLTNQTFRDLYRTETLEVNQRLKITSLTFLFTDLKGSTELYERVGDLVAYDLVKAHFHLVGDVVASEAGAVVKTIGDAVMATFPTPDRALAAALRMRDALRDLDAELTLKIGIHEGPCLAVMLNERQDYFGQTVNIASRVQNLAMSRSIFATGPVVTHGPASALLERNGIKPVPQDRTLRGISSQLTVYEIP